MASENAFAGFGQSCQHCLGREPSVTQGRTDTLTKIFKALLFRQKNESIAKTQDGERGARPQSKVLAEFFWNGELSLFSDLRGRQILKRGQSICHR